MIILNNQRYPTANETGIYGFFGPYRYLSNYHLCEITLDDVVYPSSEHCYMAQKTTDRSLQIYISQLATPKIAREFGQTFKPRDDWTDYRSVAMLRVLLAKFSDPTLKQQLLSTNHLFLEETNDWNDCYWGVCNGIGKNMLGKTLMTVREHYR